MTSDVSTSGNRDTTPGTVKRARPRKTAMIIAGALVRRIDSQGLGEGDMLPPEKELVQQYEVGRGTMREALRFLELQGVLTMRPGPNGGAVVDHPDSRHLASTFALLMQFAGTEFRSVVEARQHLEPITAALSASSPEVARVHERLTASVERMEANLQNWEVFLKENRRFHDAIAWGSGNPILGYLINSLHWITDGTVLGVDYPPRFRSSVLSAHRAIADAVGTADPEASRDAMRRHMDATLHYFQKHYANVLSQPLEWAQFG